MGTSGSTPHTRDDIREVFAELDDPSTPLTTAEVATEVECRSATAQSGLKTLEERGEIQTKRINDAGRVWWQPTEYEVASHQTGETEFSAFVSAVQDYAIFKLDPDGTVASWNRGAERIKGYRVDEIVGKHFSTFYTDADIDEGVPEQNLDAAKSAGRVEDEGWRVRKDGSQFWARVTITAVRDDDGELQGFTKVTQDMTERRKYEQQLRRERDQTEQLLRTAPIAIAVQNADGETVLANRRAQDALGLSEQEILDEPENADDWGVYDAAGDLLAPDETPSARVLATGEPVLGEEIQINPPNGDRIQFHINAAPIFDADGAIERVITAGEDITELKKREAELEQRKTELETELSQILGRVSDAFYALDDDWRFTHLNERAAEVMQRSQEKLLGQEVWDVFPDARDGVYGERLREAMDTQEPVSFEVYEEAIDIWLEFNAYPSESGLSVYFQDITERKEREQRLEDLVEKLEESNERLEQFAYAASHDLQEPLRMVSSYLQLLDQRYSDELDEDGEEFIEFAVDGADRMRAMIEGLLEYSRIETQGSPLKPIDLETTISEVLDDLQFQIEESDAEITVGSLPRVEGDADQLRQVFQNLLDNAIEYSGGEPPRIRVTAERDSGEWVISVSDEGVGIDAENPDRIFEVFQRLHSQGEHAGTGIGLAVCRRIVERHGGEIWVESKPGEGAMFSFTLPARGDSDE